MSSIIVELKPSADLLLAIDGLTQAFNRIADQMAGGASLAPKPRPPQQQGSDSWTPERYAILDRDWPIGRPTREMQAEMNALPGEPLRADQISRKAARRGLRRPLEMSEAMAARMRREPPAHMHLAAERPATAEIALAPAPDPISVPSETDDRAAPAQVAAARPTPSPGPATGSAETRMWTPERNALLKREYLTTRPTKDIHADLEKLPGRPIPYGRVAIQANKLGVKRTAEFYCVNFPDKGPLPAVSAPVPAAKPAPPKPAAVNPLLLLRTDARLAVVDEMYPAGDEIGDIIRRCNALPGQPVSMRDVLAWATARGLVRPAALSAHTSVTPPAQPVAQPRPAAAPVTRSEAVARVASSIERRPVTQSFEPIEVDFDQIRSWAAERGIMITSRDDIPVVNRKRESLGLPLFKLRLGKFADRRTA